MQSTHASSTSSLHLLVDPAQVMVPSQDVASWGDGAPFFNSVSGNSFSNSSLVQSLPRLPLIAEPVLDLAEVGGMLPVDVGQLGLWQSYGVWLLLSGFSIKGCVWVGFLLLCPTRPVVPSKRCNHWCCWVPLRPVLMSQGLAVTLDSEAVTAAHCCGTAQLLPAMLCLTPSSSMYFGVCTRGCPDHGGTAC